MRLTIRDAIGTLLAAAAVLVALDLTYGWGGPLLGDYRAGTVALAVIGFAMCGAASDYGTVRGPDPFVVLAALLGIAALGLVIGGLVAPSATMFVWLAVVIVALWFVSTVRHLVTPASRLPARPASA
jgi:hypothetical protein